MNFTYDYLVSSTTLQNLRIKLVNSIKKHTGINNLNLDFSQDYFSLPDN